jgi:hypothetical protein
MSYGDFVYIVMGVVETGEHFRMCDRQFYFGSDAEAWIMNNEDQFPESQLYVEVRDMVAD